MTLKELIGRINELYRYLLSKWLIILVVGLLGGIIGFAYSYFKKPVYTAATTFVLEENSPGGGLGSFSGLASIAGIDLGGGGGGLFQGDNILELYRSRNMIEKTLFSEVDYNSSKMLLINRYIDFNNLRDSWNEDEKLKDVQFQAKSYDVNGISEPNTRLQDSIIGTIVADIKKRSLNVSKPDKKLSIIKVEINAKDEFFAKAFNDELVKNVNDFYVQTKIKKSQENVNILQHKTDSVTKVLNSAIYSAASILDATPNLNPTHQAQRIAPSQRLQFSAETNKAILGELVKNLEMSKMSLLKETPLIQIIDHPVYPLENNKWGFVKGIAIGGLLFGFIAVLALVFKRMLFLLTKS